MSPEEFCDHHIGLAKHIALAYNHDAVDLHDLLSDALWGLFEAATTYNPAKVSPRHWAGLKIRYAIQDGYRHRNGRTTRRHAPLSLDAPAYTGHDGTLADITPQTADPLDRVLDLVDLTTTLSGLTVKERAVLVRTYRDHDRLAEVAADLGVTEGRVCQIRTAARRHLQEVAA